MSNVVVQKVNGPAKEELPIFEEIGKRFDEIRRRAFELFEKRGCEIGRDAEDWLTAEREVLGETTAEMTEKDQSYELKIALPGFEPKDVQVTATPNEIVMHAAAEHEKKSEDGKVLWTEFGSKDVYRRTEMPHPINPDKVTAKLENGVLRVVATRMAVTPEKKVSVVTA